MITGTECSKWLGGTWMGCVHVRKHGIWGGLRICDGEKRERVTKPLSVGQRRKNKEKNIAWKWRKIGERMQVRKEEEKREGCRTEISWNWHMESKGIEWKNVIDSFLLIRPIADATHVRASWCVTEWESWRHRQKKRGKGGEITRRHGDRGGEDEKRLRGRGSLFYWVKSPSPADPLATWREGRIDLRENGTPFAWHR